MSGVGCCCGHLYHNECIIKWIREAKNCPKCVRTSSVENIACLSNEPGRAARSSEDQRLSSEPNRVARLSDQQLEGEQLSVEYDKVTRLSDQQLEELQLSIELDRVTSLSNQQFEETEIQDFEFNQIIEKITNAAANNLRINEQFEDLKVILENQHGEKNLLLRQMKTMKEQTKELGELLEKERLENGRKGKEIDKKNKEIMEKVKTIDEKVKKIEEKDKEIEKKCKEIETKNKEIEGKNKEIEDKNKEIEKLKLEMLQLKESINVPSQPSDMRQMQMNNENDRNLIRSPLTSTDANNQISVANPQFTPSQINCPERVTVRRKFIPKVQNLERVPIAKKRPAMKVVNGASPAMSVFGKNKQVPVNLLAASKPWRPHGTKQHQLHKPSHQNNKTPNNIGITKSAKRKLRLDSPIGSPMFTSTPNDGRKFPAFVIG
uniref:RING-type domain-containing protein n=1 Tax=Meloidogyne incognita TaxID=6306 RepID=A0A914M272_MELIC